jgi:hypothetical protein
MARRLRVQRTLLKNSAIQHGSYLDRLYKARQDFLLEQDYWRDNNPVQIKAESAAEREARRESDARRGISWDDFMDELRRKYEGVSDHWSKGIDWNKG